MLFLGSGTIKFKLYIWKLPQKLQSLLCLFFCMCVFTHICQIPLQSQCMHLCTCTRLTFTNITFCIIPSPTLHWKSNKTEFGWCALEFGVRRDIILALAHILEACSCSVVFWQGRQRGALWWVCCFSTALWATGQSTGSLLHISVFCQNTVKLRPVINCFRVLSLRRSDRSKRLNFYGKNFLRWWKQERMLYMISLILLAKCGLTRQMTGI